MLNEINRERRRQKKINVLSLVPCKCGESDPLVLKSVNGRTVCFNCLRKEEFERLSEEEKEELVKKRLKKFQGKQCVCGESHIAVLENHHLAGGHKGETVTLCLNCHAKQTDNQLDWPEDLLSEDRTPEYQALAFFMGLGSLLILLGTWCIKFAKVLYDFVRTNDKKKEEIAKTLPVNNLSGKLQIRQMNFKSLQGRKKNNVLLDLRGLREDFLPKEKGKL